MTAHAVEKYGIREAMERFEALSSVVCSLFGNSESWIESLPLPAWVTAPTGEMLMFNQSYADTYNKSRAEYFGQKNDAVWKQRVADGFDQNNDAVVEADAARLFWESLGLDHTILVLKFPVYDGNKLLGVGGIVLSDDRADGIPRIDLALAQEPGRQGGPS